MGIIVRTPQWTPIPKTLIQNSFKYMVRIHYKITNLEAGEAATVNGAKGDVIVKVFVTSIQSKEHSMKINASLMFVRISSKSKQIFHEFNQRNIWVRRSNKTEKISWKQVFQTWYTNWNNLHLCFRNRSVDFTKIFQSSCCEWIFAISTLHCSTYLNYLALKYFHK